MSFYEIEFPPRYRYLTDPVETREALSAFSDHPVIGLDTETFWDFNARCNRLSLLQLAAPSGEVVVIDGLSAAIFEARHLIAEPEARLAAHNAGFDDGVLRGSGFEVAGLFDTLRLSRRTLKLESFSLSSVSAHLFDLPLDKTWQRSDWRQRPLSRHQLDYAALDAVIAMRVYQELTRILDKEGRLEKELQRARVKTPAELAEEREMRQTAKRSLADSLRPLTPDERTVFDRLSAWREARAKLERLPVYMVCPDRTLAELAINRPSAVDQLAKIYGLGPTRIAKYGEQMLALLRNH
ncbi:MAG: HRDC domain-containing protein [Blastocatellales bacterium]